MWCAGARDRLEAHHGPRPSRWRRELRRAGPGGDLDATAGPWRCGRGRLESHDEKSTWAPGSTSKHRKKGRNNRSKQGSGVAADWSPAAERRLDAGDLARRR